MTVSLLVLWLVMPGLAAWLERVKGQPGST
jgi:hypothetical protein